MHLSLTPPSVRMDNVVIAEAPQFGSGPFASMQAIDASIKLWPLLHKQVELQSLDLKQPKVELIRDAQGVWNFSTLGRAHKAPSKPEQNQGGFVLSNLKISDGQVTLLDEQKHFRGVYNNIDVTLHDYRARQSLRFHRCAAPARSRQGNAGAQRDRRTHESARPC